MTLYSHTPMTLSSENSVRASRECADLIASALNRVFTAENHHVALEVGLQEVVRLTGARRGVLLIRPRPDDEMYPLFTYGGGLTHAYKFSDFKGVSGGWVLSWPQAEAAGWTSLPLNSFGDLVGAIYLDRVSYTAPLAEQKRVTVELLTSQLALVLALIIEDNELFQVAKERQTSLEMLAAVGQIGERLNASLSMDQAMADFAESCRFLLDAERCTVFEVDWEAGILSYLGGDPLEGVDGNPVTLSLYNSIAGWVARSGEVALVADVSCDPRHDPAANEFLPLIDQLVCIPFRLEGRLRGVVEVTNKLSGSFTELDLSLLQLLTTSTVIAIENAQRYNLQEAEVKQKAELYSVASHGLRSPLMSIITWIDWILETGVQNDLHKARLEDIRSQTFNLSRFVGEILDMSRIEVGNLRLQLMPLALVPVVKKLVSVFEMRAPSHRFAVEVDGTIPPVRADEMQLSIILDHLLENAIKYSPPGSLVQVNLRGTDELVYVSVADKGPGIPAEEVYNLFTRFYRGRQAAKGHSLGLGLYISRKLVEAQGGNIWVDSEVGAGSTFTFTLVREQIGD